MLMAFLQSFPTRSEAPLDVWEVDNSEVQFSEWKYCNCHLPTPVWLRRYCVCLENEQTFVLFSSHKESLKRPSAAHIPISILGRFEREHCVIEKNGARFLLTLDNDPKHSSSNPLHHSCLHLGRTHADQPNAAVHSYSIRLTDDTGVRKHSDPGVFRHPIRSMLPTKHASSHHKLTTSKSSVSKPDRPTMNNAAVIHDSASTNVDLPRELEFASISLLDSSSRTNNSSSSSIHGNLDSSRLFTSDADLFWTKVVSASRIQKLFRSIRRSFSFHNIRRKEFTHPYMSYNQNASSQLLVFELNDSTRSSKSHRRLPHRFHWTDKNDMNGNLEGRFRHLIVSDVLRLENSSINTKSTVTTSAIGDASSQRLSITNSCTNSATNRHSLMESTLRPFKSSHHTSDRKPISLSQIRQVYNYGEIPVSNSFPPDAYFLGASGLVYFGPIHPSLAAGRAFCFICLAPIIPSSSQIRAQTDLVTRIFAAPSQLSRLRWLRSLRRTAKPDLENERHRENSFRLSILEARNLPPKRRYYCDICLDRTLYARTTSKAATPGVFWAEDFDLNNLPNVSVVTISLYKEAESAHKDGRRFVTSRSSAKKNRKSQNQLLGYVTIPTFELCGRTDTQLWVTLQPPSSTGSSELMSAVFIPSLHTQNGSQSMTSVEGVGRPGGYSGQLPYITSNTSGTHLSQSHLDQRHLPQLRIKARYQSIEVLPLRAYLALKKLIIDHSLELTSWLEQILSVKCKENVAGSLVALHESNGTLVEFLTNLVVRDLADLENDSMAFRSNSMATKAVECYVKVVGSTYLYNLLHRLIQCVLACPTAWEVNPEKLSSAALTSGSLSVSDTAVFASTFQLPQSDARLPPGSLMANQVLLLHHLNAVWRAIQASLPRFPSALIRVFSAFRTALEPTRGPEFCDNLVSACIFLRLICPALLSPSLFGLVTAFPSDPACRRNLTLLAKSLQSLANFSAFDDKEPFMRFLNGFVSSQLPAMRRFIRGISRWPSSEVHLDDFDTKHGLRDLVDEGFELAHLHSLLSDLPLDSEIKTSSNCDNAIPLPPSLSELPQVLNDLSTLLRGTLASCTQSLVNITDGHLKADTRTADRLHSTLPSNISKRLRDLTDFTLPNHLSTYPQDSQSPSDYAYHSLKTHASVPYYTLHTNPGYHDYKVQKSTSVNIFSAPTDLTSSSLSSTGQTGVSIPNPNDYDEPYASPLSESEDDSYKRTTSSPPVRNSASSVLTGKGERISTKQTEKTPRRDSAPAPPLSPSNSTPIITCTPSDDDHVYDFVPLSGASSTDDLVQANEKYLIDSRNRSLQPKALDPDTASQQQTSFGTTSPYSSEQITPTAHSAPIIPVPSASQLANDHHYYPHRTLDSHTIDSSPRLQPRQVATASILLTRQAKVLPPAEPQSAILSPHPNVVAESLNSPILSRSDGVMSASTWNNDVQSAKIDLPSPDSFPPHSSPSLDTSASSLSQTDSASHLPFSSDAHTRSSSVPKALVDELVHLRHQLRLSRENAARAANRLSQQEAELSHLRQLVGRLRGQPQVSCKPTDSPRPLTTGLDQVPSNGHSQRTGTPAATAAATTAPASGNKRSQTTFDELDDAMARLEQEQVELQQEQARIRARLAASRLSHSATSPMRGVSSSSQLTPKPASCTIKKGLQPSKAVSSLSSLGEEDVTLLTLSRGSSHYGPRNRHDPPPAPPRNVTRGGRFVY